MQAQDQGSRKGTRMHQLLRSTCDAELGNQGTGQDTEVMAVAMLGAGCHGKQQWNISISLSR